MNSTSQYTAHNHQWFFRALLFYVHVPFNSQSLLHLPTPLFQTGLTDVFLYVYMLVKYVFYVFYVLIVLIFINDLVHYIFTCSHFFHKILFFVTIKVTMYIGCKICRVLHSSLCVSTTFIHLLSHSTPCSNYA